MQTSDETTPVHVIGATGRSGAALSRALGSRVIPVVRNPGRWTGDGVPRVADLDGQGLPEALGDARILVSCAHARHIPAILAAAPATARFVFLGSTRKFTRWPDSHGNGVLAGEAAFLASGRAGVLLHPTMIYGAEGEDNVQRLAALLRRLPFVPLPDGGRAMVQPIHQSDLTRAVLAAIGMEWRAPETIVVAGPSPVSYAEFVRAVARAAGLAPPRILPVPGVLLRLAAPLSRLPGLPRIRSDEIRRLLEDKAFDIGQMRSRLGVAPISLDQGLSITFATPSGCR